MFQIHNTEEGFLGTRAHARKACKVLWPCAHFIHSVNPQLPV